MERIDEILQIYFDPVNPEKSVVGSALATLMSNGTVKIEMT